MAGSGVVGILSVVGIQRRGQPEGPEMRLQLNLGE